MGGCASSPQENLSQPNPKTTLNVVRDIDAMDFSNLFKVVFLGDSGSGKTSLYRRYTQGIFEGKRSMTKALSCMSFSMSYTKPGIVESKSAAKMEEDDEIDPSKAGELVLKENGIKICSSDDFKDLDSGDTHAFLYLMDLPGHRDQKQSVLFDKSHLREVDVALLVFSVIDGKSFEMLEDWANIILNESPDCKIWLVGNKIDLTEKRVITTGEAKKKARARNWFYSETSALTGENVYRCLRDLINTVRKERVL